MDVLEDDGKVAGVVLDGRDVVDRLAEAALFDVDQPVERAALDVDEVGDLEGLVQARKAAARARGVNGSQDGDSSGGSKVREAGA